MADFPLGAIIGAGASLASGIDQRAADRKAMKNRISWTVADAKRAGIHPLAALGANIQSIPSQPLLGDAAIGGLTEGFNRMASSSAAASLEETRSRTRKNDAEAAEAVARSRTLARSVRQPSGATIGAQSMSGADPANFAIRSGPGRTFPVDPRYSDAQVLQDRYGEIVEELGGIRNWFVDRRLQYDRERGREHRRKVGSYIRGGRRARDQTPWYGR